MPDITPTQTEPDRTILDAVGEVLAEYDGQLDWFKNDIGLPDGIRSGFVKQAAFLIEGLAARGLALVTEDAAKAIRDEAINRGLTLARWGMLPSDETVDESRNLKAWNHIKPSQEPSP